MQLKYVCDNCLPLGMNTRAVCVTRQHQLAQTAPAATALFPEPEKMLLLTTSKTQHTSGWRGFTTFCSLKACACAKDRLLV